jgi:hypothetical protein
MHFVHNRHTDGREVVSLTYQPYCTLQALISVSVNSGLIVRLEGLGEFRQKVKLILDWTPYCTNHSPWTVGFVVVVVFAFVLWAETASTLCVGHYLTCFTIPGCWMSMEQLLGQELARGNNNWGKILHCHSFFMKNAT